MIASLIISADPFLDIARNSAKHRSGIYGDLLLDDLSFLLLVSARSFFVKIPWI